MISDTGNVTIVITTDAIPETDTIPDVVTGYNSLFTLRAKNTLKERFEKGYVAGAGFSDDITKTNTSTVLFLANPSQYRPTFGDAGGAPDNDRQAMHLAALKAYAQDDGIIANVVATEILATVNTNSLNTNFWTNTVTGYNFRVDTQTIWIQVLEVKKMMHSLERIEHIQTILSDAELQAIEVWFETFIGYMYNALHDRLEIYLGADWDLNGLSKFNNQGIYPSQSENPFPIQDINGQNLVTMVWAQDSFNNRNWDVISAIHAWAVKNNDVTMESWCREFFKISIKYALFSDGTWWEMQRATTASPYNGIWYGWVSLGAMIEVAHLDAMANHFPNDRLYDYSTTDGILEGSTNITNSPFPGTSTTDGVTPKSVKLFLEGQMKYYRPESNGGWNDIRFFKNSNSTLIPLDCIKWT